jgi:hypothetical protein
MVCGMTAVWTKSHHGDRRECRGYFFAEQVRSAISAISVVISMQSGATYMPNFSISSFLPSPRMPCLAPTFLNAAMAVSRWCFSWAAES